MARKRLNVKFLVLGLGPVLLLAGGLVAWKVVPKVFPKTRWLVHGTPDEHASKARGFFEEGKYQEAVEAYEYAIFLKAQGDAPMYTALGDSYSHLILKDDEARIKAAQFYEAALGTDPKYMPALERVLEWRLDEAELFSGARAVQAWEQVGAIAKRVLAADPSNRKARTAEQRAILSKWRAGTEIPVADVDAAISAMLALANEEPFDAEAAFYVMQAWMSRVQTRLQQADRDGANRIIADVMKLVTETLAKHPNDALLHFRAGMAYRGMGLAERSANQPPKYLEETEREFRLAAELVKPDHPQYLDIKLFYGKILEGKPETVPAAEKLYRTMLAEQPTELAVRVALAELLSRSPSTQLEAVTLLEQAPPQDLTRYSGIKAFLARGYERTALFDLINIKLDIAGRMRGQPTYDAMLTQIDQLYAKLIAMPGIADSPMALQTRGRIELAKGQNFDAVQTLSRALNIMGPNASGAPDEARYRLQYFLASAYVLTGQTGEAKSYLAQIVQDIPNLINARLMLTQLLLTEHRNDEAKPHLDRLMAMLPNDSRVVRMKIQSLDKVKDKDLIWELYSKLPQTTPEAIIEKAQVAVYIERRDEAVKLFEGLRETRPNDASVLVSLARLNSELGDKPRALELVDLALKLHPDHPQLKLLRAEVAGADVAGVRTEILEGITDPFRKALLQYELAVQEDRKDEAEQFLQTLIQLNPEEGRVVELVFNRALIQRDWPKALESVEKLARQDRDGVGGMLYRIRYYLAKGELDPAADLANQLVSRMREFAPSYVVLGQVQKAQKKYFDAMQSFETALQKRPAELTSLRELIELSYLTNSPTKAREYINQARRVFPNYVLFKEQDLAHEMRYGDPEKVLVPRQEMLDAAIARKDPAEARQWVALGNAYLAVARTKDTPQAARPFLEKARDTFASAMAKFPDEMQIVDLFADAQLQLRNPAEGEKAIIALRDREAWKGKPEPTILLASYMAKTGRAADQEKVLRDYLATVPAAVPVQLELSYLLGRQDKVDEALKILEINADQPEIRRQRIELQIANNRIADAEREIKTAMDATTDPSPMILNRQAFVLMKSGRDTEALQVLGRTLAKSPNDMEALYLQASLYLKAQRNLSQAISNLQAARDNRFKESESRYLLSEAYHYNNDDDAAIRELEEAVRAFPEEKRARLRLLDYYSRPSGPNWVQAERLLRDARNTPKLANDVDIINAEARMWLARKQPSRAVQVLTDGMSTHRDNMDLFRSYCQALLDSRDYQNLIRATEQSVQQKRAPWWVYEYRGKARRQLDDRPAALAEFQAGMDVAWAANDENASAVLLNSIAQDVGIPVARRQITDRANAPGGYRWQLMMSYLSLLENDFDTAITWAEKVANDANVTADYRDSARRQLGTLYLRATPPQVGKAVAVYRQIIQTSPEDVVSLNNLASAMILPNSSYPPRDALEFSQRAYRIVAAGENTNETMRAMKPYIYDTHGYVLVLAGQTTEGINLLQQALDQEPIPDACLHLAEAYLKLPTPRTGEAIEILKQGVALLEAAARDNKPVDPEIKSKIEKTLEAAEAAGRGRG